MKKWIKLDNAAKIYPPTQTKKRAAMFRLSVVLTEDVDPDILADAQSNTLRRFPSFACRLRRGFFWYYLEHMSGEPPIFEDVYSPMQNMNGFREHHFMYRLLYSRHRIAVECFHMLTDGTGAMTFLLSLVNEYLRLKYGVDGSGKGSKFVLSCDEKPAPEEYEDSFLRYAGKTIISRSEKASYQTGGTPMPLNKLMFISGTVPTDKLLEKAKEYHVSVGVFLAANLLYAVHKKQQHEKSARKRSLPVKISVPINLRRFFPSKTVRNFSSFVNPGIESRFGNFTFEEILAQVEHFMGMHITEKELRARFSANVASEHNPFLRVAPLILKDPVMKIFFRMQGDRYHASSISNLGVINLVPEIAQYITAVDLTLGRPATRRSSCACVSYNGKTIINFSRTTMEAEVERYFFTHLVRLGIPVFIESNGRF
ncbi:MAG: alcohol acetyltransferase [Clostridia bacterium]|nr:alcohol acetyltransferase [Clostridia bacterium]